MTPPDDMRERDAFAELVAVCRRLRGPDGCPWDRDQTLETMTPYLAEEAAESAEAIANGDPTATAEELGDLMFLGVFCLELLGDRGGPGLADALQAAADKLVRRHPHVYGGAAVADGDAAYRQWQEIKQSERGGRGSLLGDQPKGLAALVAAYRVQEKAAAVGFDWPDSAGAFLKAREELEEVEQAVAAGAPPEVAREIGDLLFSIVNVSRHLRVDPECELRGASARFRTRFHHVEERLAAQGRRVADTPLTELDALWDEAKSLESSADLASPDPAPNPRLDRTVPLSDPGDSR